MTYLGGFVKHGARRQDANIGPGSAKLGQYSLKCKSHWGKKTFPEHVSMRQRGSLPAHHRTRKGGQQLVPPYHPARNERWGKTGGWVIARTCSRALGLGAQCSRTVTRGTQGAGSLRHPAATW